MIQKSSLNFDTTDICSNYDNKDNNDRKTIGEAFWLTLELKSKM